MMQVGNISDILRDDTGKIAPGEIEGCYLIGFLVTFDAGPVAPNWEFLLGEPRGGVPVEEGVERVFEGGLQRKK